MTNEIRTINDFKAQFENVTPIAESFIYGHCFMLYLSEPENSLDYVALVAHVKLDDVSSIKDTTYEAIESAEIIEHEIVRNDNPDELSDDMSDFIKTVLRITHYEDVEHDAFLASKRMINAFLAAEIKEERD